MIFELRSEYLGPVSAFFSSVTWAIGSTGYARLSRRYSAFAINFSRALLALPFFIIFVFFSAGSVSAGFAQIQVLQWDQVGWLSLAMLASYGLGDVMFMWSSRSLGVSGALALASTYPLWMSIAGFIFQGEHLTHFQWIGLIFSILGIGVVILSSPQSEDRPSHGRKGLIQGVLLAVLTSFLWSLHGYAVNRGGQGLGLALGNSVRMIAALFMCYGTSKVFQPNIKLILPREELQKSFWIFASEVVLGSCLFMYGMSHSPLVIGSTLSALAPVISVPAAWLLRIEKVSLVRTVGVFLVVFGIVFLLSGV